MIDRECPVCHATYQADPQRLKHGRQTTCSRACSYQLRGVNRERKARLVCAACGNEFERAVSYVKGKHGAQFCSRACHYRGRTLGLSKRVVTRPYVISDAGRAGWSAGAKKTAQTRRQRNNYRKSDATRAKLSIATARALAKSNAYAISKLERKVGAHLADLGLTPIPQYVFRDDRGRFACVVDFYFPELRVALEVNGTYWHADPRVYPTPINEMQRRCVVRYQRKLTLLAGLGVRVVEVWEQDLNADIAQAMCVAHAQLIRR